MNLTEKEKQSKVEVGDEYKEEVHPIFHVLRKIMMFVHQDKLENRIEKNKEKIKAIHWELKPLEESDIGLMAYRLIAFIDGKKHRVEKNNIYEPSYFHKREAEIYISNLMNKYPEIEQSVNLIKIHRFDQAEFNRIESSAMPAKKKMNIG